MSVKLNRALVYLFMGYWLLVAPFLTMANAESKNAFVQPLNAAATKVSNPAHQAIIAMAHAGNRLVGVGLRGLVIISNDKGETWHQSPCPVQTDLTDVFFLNKDDGWAVGHDSVILHTQDGGLHWVKQLDSQSAEKELVGYYKSEISRGNSNLKSYLETIKQNFGPHRAWPFLGVWFLNKNIGYAVGAFGMIVRTSDGGASWVPWLEHINNPLQSNLNSITNIGGELYIPSDSGSVFKSNKALSKADFKSLNTGYTGSFIGVVGKEKLAIAFGISGSIYITEDAGHSWHSADQNIISGALTGGAVVGDKVILVTEHGQILESNDFGKHYSLKNVPRSMVLSGAVPEGTSKLILYGLNGVELSTIN